MPARELADGALILIGGTLMLAPGFVTDAFGILMILPFTRPFFRRLLTRVVCAAGWCWARTAGSGREMLVSPAAEMHNAPVLALTGR